MKKIILLPQKDTVTLCLPKEWVGIPVICKLTPLDSHKMHTDEYPFEIEKNRVDYKNQKK